MPYLKGKDTLYNIDKDKVVVGRSEDADIVIQNSYISRNHAEILKKGNKWFLRDLNSTYGTTVNGNPVSTEVLLNDHDIIGFGPVSFEFSLDIPEDVNPRSIQNVKDFLCQLRSEKKEYSGVIDEIIALLDEHEELKQELAMYKFLYNLTEVIDKLDNEHLLSFIFENIVDLTGAERAVIVKVSLNGEYQPVYYHGLTEDIATHDPLPRSIITKVIESREPLIISNAVEDPTWGAFTSIMSLNIRSVLAFPLMEENNLLAVIYLENRTMEGIFQKTHLKMAEYLSSEISAVLTRSIVYPKKVRERLAYLKEHYDFSGLIGESEKFVEILESITKVAPTDVPCLLVGESGTGKELIAKAIHKNSKRKDGPFVVINCATIPKELFEAELFGYKKGAFSGAYKDKKGKIEMADGGTLFLDELAELPLEIQAKLLRLIQFKEIEVLGSPAPKRVDIRIIGATSRPLKELLNKGYFREDLYYRLNVFQIYLPPLRQRKEDIPVLARHFLKNIAPDKRLSQDAISLLLSYDFPGNIRELENIITRAAVISAREKIIKSHHLPEELRNVQKDRDYNNPEVVKRVLRETNFNITKAAEKLGISRRHLYRIMEKYDIKKDKL